MNHQSKAALRILRLYHWRTALHFRAQGLNESADFHIGFVQMLNEFFDLGDTADRDDQRMKGEPLKPAQGPSYDE